MLKNLKTLQGFPLFRKSVFSRLKAGLKEYGDTSFSSDPLTLIGEVKEEMLDICGWSYILFERLNKIERHLSALSVADEEDE